MSREFDVVLYGATGFTGRQTAHYFAEHAPRDLKWAIAGRNGEKLEALAAELGREDVGVVVADGHDPAAVTAMCARTRVLLTTAGPYSLYGDRVVEGCVASATDYVDITGETPWVRQVINRHHEKAKADGTRIIPFCGFDSVPSDIGALALVEHLRDLGTDTRRVEAAFTGKGGFNGGTLASAINMGEQGLLEQVEDPSLLNPASMRPNPNAEPDPQGPSKLGDRWMAPFMMGPINTRVVRRSHALATEAGQGYGPRFTYQEYMDCGRGLKGLAMATAVGTAMAASRPMVGTSSGRALLKRMGPAPGQGPSEETLDSGFVRVRYRAEGEDGTMVTAILKSDGDPGNRFTVRVLCESALALVLDRDALPPGGGVLTPATGLGMALLRRLQAAGVSFEIN